MPKLNALVAGSTGYIGVQLIKLLVKHKYINIKYLCGNTSVGKKITYYDKSLSNKRLPKIIKFDKNLLKDIDVVFTALPNGSAHKIVKKLNSETIPLEGTHLGINYKSETDSIFRVSFSWDGIIDNWHGIVYDPSGKIMRCNESDPRFPDNGIKDNDELSKLRMILGGLLYKVDRLGGHWYLCWFT